MEPYLSLVNKTNVAGVVIGFILLVYLVYVFLIQYHLVRFGIGIKPKMTAAIFLIGSIVLLFPVIFFYIKFDAQDFIKAIGGSINNDLPGSYKSNFFQ
jgi:uncharacterized membrane protein (DUF485 family)